MKLERLPSRAPGARRGLTLGAAGLSALVALLSTSSAMAVDKRAEAAARAAIKKASGDYLSTNYDAASTRLKKAIRTCGATKCSPGTLAALLRDLGTMQFRSGDVGAAKQTWADALKAQADIALNPDYDTPDLRAAFEDARGTTGAGAMGEQPSGDFAHTPAGEQKVNTPLPVYVEYPGSGGLVRVVVKYKGAAMSDWGRVDLKRNGHGWGGLIPCASVTKGVMRYWVQGFDDGGDPVGSSGDPKHPYTVAIKDDLAGESPHLPGQKPPKSCGEDTECPPGLPGCASEEEAKSSDSEATSEEPAEKAPPGTYVHFWFGLTGALDFLSMPAGQNVCLLNPGNAQPLNNANYYCTNPDGSDFPRRNDGGAQNTQLAHGQAGNVPGGFQPGNVRVMFAFDYALSASFLVGARGGYVANAYTGQAAVKDGRAFGSNVDIEARATYLFGDHPLANVGFAPMVFGGMGAAEFDGHTTTIVQLVSQQPVNAWVTDGPFFVVVGGGARYAFSPRAAFSLALRVNGAFGNGFLATYGPEVGIQYGF
jgi:hypothetical protein